MPVHDEHNAHACRQQGNPLAQPLTTNLSNAIIAPLIHRSSDSSHHDFLDLISLKLAMLFCWPLKKKIFFKDHIAEISNCISDQGYLPLQLALTSKNLAIAETLVKNGFANINAYDAEDKWDYAKQLLGILYIKLVI
ncbi:unnamed protein product [Ceratitis capitata]|uniref:(Mediterranean fruit fly) hypothetical protein n=1 Tax=Ceratitis capitata TaxID=7213 RepID=A0A811UC24_CERCA|nr:unnamed protein product [Ceratitis capitata]